MGNEGGVVRQGGIIETIGNTPLVELTRLPGTEHLRVFGKLELANPGGSLKDRPARAILSSAWARGEIGPGSTVIEASSGNFAVGLAQMCAYLGLRLICVLDARATPQSIQLIQAYGAEIELVLEPDPVSGEFLQACVQRVQSLCAKIPNAFWPNQHGNLDNAASHRETMAECDAALAGEIDYLFCATSTCGTLRGCAEYIREKGLRTQVVAVDALGSLIFSNEQHKRIIPGHGAGKPPALLTPGLADHVTWVDARSSIEGCRLLLKREAILAGGSSGGLVSAFLKFAPELPPDATCVLVLCDRGERYLQTIYSDAWVVQHYPDYFTSKELVIT